MFSRRVLRAAKRNEDGVRVLKIEWEKKFSCAELLSLDRAGLMGVRPQGDLSDCDNPFHAASKEQIR